MAYNLRSKVVHGSTITEKDLKKAGVNDLTEFVSQTERILRTALGKAIVDAASSGSFKPEWNAMVLAGCSGSRRRLQPSASASRSKKMLKR